MRPFVICLMLSVTIISLLAENLIFNGDLHELLDDAPLAWVSNPYADFHATGGPQNKPFVRLNQSKQKTYENKFRQHNLTLVEGSRYSLSAWIRTKGFHSHHHGVVITNYGWFAEEGLKNFPADSDWTFYKTTFTCPASKSVNGYGFVCFACDQTGIMDVADIQLEALDEAGVKGSRPTGSVEGLFRPRLVPYDENLNSIRMDNPKITLRWFGQINGSDDLRHYSLQLFEDSSGYASAKVPLIIGKSFDVPLIGLGEGWHRLTCRVLDNRNGAVVHELPLHARLRSLPRPEEATPSRRMNNFTCEFFNGHVANGATVELVILRDGWFYMAIQNAKGKTRLLLDDTPIITDTTPRTEAFRYLEAGRHSISLGCDGTLIVRSIAETLCSAILEGPRMTTFPKYDWEFAKKWAAYSLTNFNRGSPNEDVLKECHDMGRIWTTNLFMADFPAQEVIDARLKKSLANLKADGVTVDEFSYNWQNLDPYTLTLQTADYDQSKLIYTWCTLKPKISSIHGDFIATCLNASHGRGKILSEVYLKTMPSEEEARQFLDKSLTKPFAVTRDFYPDMARRSGIILGNFNQIGVITLEHHPQVDYKYYLDMQMHLLATHPIFMDLGTTGYWGAHYADEEMYRWSAKLLRHYVVEGHTDMLSKTYHFSYLPGHIRNNDFEDGLNGWKAEAAADGAISIEYYDEFNHAIQNRWPQASVGNHFCVFKRQAGKANRLSQTAHGLVPGKKYMLLFCTADLDDVKDKRLKPRQLGLDAQMDGMKIIENMVWVDNRVNGNYNYNHNVARMNVHRIIFTPEHESITLSFTDAAAKEGETLIMNYIQLKPFFAPEE